MGERYPRHGHSRPKGRPRGHGVPQGGGPQHGGRQPFHKPPLSVQTTTLWDYPSQHYGPGMQGDKNYVGATPSYVIWNLVQRYTDEGALVVDPFCGSGTTLDVARDTKRRARGFDISPQRPDIERADARKLPLPDGTADLVFLDPPYGDHIDYSDAPECIGRLSAFEPAYFTAMDQALRECARILKPGGVIGLYVCDFFQKKRGFVPVGVKLFSSLCASFTPVDIIAVTRHNKSLKLGNYHKAAAVENFFLRGFNYLFIARKVHKEGAWRGPSASGI